MNLTISHPSSILKGQINLPLSKSESNRILILQALSKGKIDIGSLSDARDTKLLQSALTSDTGTIDINDAGTAMRFLTAYYCATGQHKVLTGSARMQERPIGILVDALREIGFEIRYLKNDGFPPLEIIPADPSKLKGIVNIAGNVSSQYISALMMVAPVLENGLEIGFTTSLSSKPYLMLTAAILEQAGIRSEISDGCIRIAHQPFTQKTISASADWSAASYWLSMAALSSDFELMLDKLNTHSHQGDRQIAGWAKYFHIATEQRSEGLFIHSDHSENSLVSDLHFDFIDYPDLAQTMIVLCAAKNIKATFTGLQSLRIKETDRIAALQNELQKFGVKLVEIKDGTFQLSGIFQVSHQAIHTYNDHRMAMAFAPLALLGEINIENEEVVEKSYPDFWKEMKGVGFEITSGIPQ